ncbi:MAG: phytanoyl-CoA dioxygenase family protein [Armatimonadota bacterium]|nr:phytanoyl-CoA dioxygenase family protein [Armatimonadota bacterium]
MKLTYTQKQHFYDHGFLQISGIVPRVMVDAVLGAINHSVGQGMPPDEMVTMRAQTFCREITRTPVISDLFNATPAKPLAESMLGTGNLNPVGGGQIALRFPGLQDPPPEPRPHLDGMYTPTNGVPQGTIGNFTMLVAVLLSDLTCDYAGNFTVWPGTHHAYERYFRKHGPESLLNGMPPITLPPARQIRGQAGDIVFAHYELAHAAAANVSPHVRYAIFFRLKHVDHDSDPKKRMSDIWLDWPGMDEVRQKEKGKRKRREA